MDLGSCARAGSTKAPHRWLSSFPTRRAAIGSSMLKTFCKGPIRMPYQSVSPFNGEILRTFDEHSDQQMEKMLGIADQTFREVWSKKLIRERAKVIGKAASLMLEQKEKFARLATLEM